MLDIAREYLSGSRNRAGIDFAEISVDDRGAGTCGSIGSIVGCHILNYCIQCNASGLVVPEHLLKAHAIGVNRARMTAPITNA